MGGIDGGEGKQSIVIEGGKLEHIGKDSQLHIVQNRYEKVDWDQSVTVDGNHWAMVKKTYGVSSDEQIFLISKSVLISGLEQLQLEGPGGGFISIGPGGVVTIKGTTVLINSGGMPVGGASVSSFKPEDATFPDRPEPDPRRHHKTGQKSTPY